MKIRFYTCIYIYSNSHVKCLRQYSLTEPIGEFTNGQKTAVCALSYLLNKAKLPNGCTCAHITRVVRRASQCNMTNTYHIMLIASCPLLTRDIGDGWVVRWYWVSFHCRGVLLIWIIVGQGSTAPAIGAGRGCLDIFLSSIISHFFLPFSGKRPDID